jgi:Bacterial conjugation TrbI-like protein
VDDNENVIDQKTTTTTDLQALTQAPTIQTITSEQEFSPEEMRSPRPSWKKPVPKLAMVALILCPAFVLVWGFFNGISKPKYVNTPSQKLRNANSPTQSSKEIARLQNENSDLKAGLALNDQVKLESQLRRVREQKRQPQKRTEMSKQPVARTASAPTTMPRAIAQIPAAPRIQTTPVSRPTSVSRRTPSVPSRVFDPMERWQELAQLGSYGSIRPDESLPQPEFSDTDQATQRANQAMLNTPYKVASTSIPTARIAPTSAVQSSSPESSSRVPILEQRPIPRDEPAPTPEASHSDEPLNPSNPQTERSTPSSILEKAETRILEGTSQPQALTVGISSRGELVTPIAIDEAGRSDRFIVKINEPLMDNHGQVAFPAGTELVVQIDSVSETGQVHSSAIAATWSINGQQRELILPPNTIQIRGKGGEPLVAEHFEDRGDEIAGMDAGQFMLGAFGRAAQLYNRSDSRIQTRGSSTIITENNPAPNIVAGLVEGGTDAVLDSIRRRNQQAIERLEQMPNIRFIKAGTDVEIFVN